MNSQGLLYSQKAGVNANVFKLYIDKKCYKPRLFVQHKNFQTILTIFGTPVSLYVQLQFNFLDRVYLCISICILKSINLYLYVLDT